MYCVQGGKKRAVKSRLAQSGRLEETANKTAVANALGLSAADKLASVGGKLGSMALGGKGALASKLPMALSTGAKPDPVSAARPVIKERAVPPQVPSFLLNRARITLLAASSGCFHKWMGVIGLQSKARIIHHA